MIESPNECPNAEPRFRKPLSKSLSAQHEFTRGIPKHDANYVIYVLKYLKYVGTFDNHVLSHIMLLNVREITIAIRSPSTYQFYEYTRYPTKQHHML